MSIEIVQLSGQSGKVTAEALERFRAVMRGPVLVAGDPGYDEARVIWSNEYSERRPAIIARCTGTADVVDAVRFAREHDLLTAVKGGGHGIQGFATCDDGIMIDMSAHMTAVLLEEDRNVARVQGGCTLGDVDRETTRAGLAVPTGVAPTTGMGGLTTGGGVGWLHRKYGLTLDNLLSVEIVTADGEVLRASDTEHPDLFWAVRGGGGNFGVITEFEFQAHPVSDEVAFALVSYPLEQMPQVARAWRDWTRTVPDEVTSRLITLAPIDHPNMERELVGRDLVIVGAMHSGTAEEGEPVVEPVRHLGDPIMDLSGRYGFREIQTKFDLMVYGDWSGYWKSVYLDHLEDEVIDVAVKWSNDRPIGTAVTQLLHMGGAIGRPGPGDTAFGDRSAPYLLSAETAWQGRELKEACTRWAQGLIGDAEALGCTHGTYLNFNGETDQTSRRAQFGENMTRLREIKKRYDPSNLFRCNNNIPPAE
jgi:FAD/FMN-containing dehydrogenase